MRSTPRRFTKLRRLGELIFRRERDPKPSRASRNKRFLVVMDHWVPAGGALRFVRAAGALEAAGHELRFLVFNESGGPPPYAIDERAAFSTRWDAVMIPGAGFPRNFINRLGVFRVPRFGTRIQHVLNDRSGMERFCKVNRTFRPDIVAYNSLAWSIPGDSQLLPAERHGYLIGAVNCDEFRFGEKRFRQNRFVLGAQSHKNRGPIVAALRELSQTVSLQLIGKGSLNAEEEDLVQSGRIQHLGRLPHETLPKFYAGLDAMVHSEDNAGWANVAAEAMAAGVPVICTPAGTEAFARHEENALVLDAPTPTAIANAVERLRTEPRLRERLVVQGRQTIEHFTWERYASELVELLDGRAITRYRNPVKTLRHSLLRVRDVAPLERRIFVSFPKSGRTWLRYALTHVEGGTDIAFTHDGFEYNNGDKPPLNFDVETRLARYGKGDRLVFLRRDPRDTIVSLFHQVTGRFKDFFAYEGTISEFIRDPYFGAHNLAGFLEMWGEVAKRRPVLEIHYEDCHDDFEGVLREVAEFLELSVRDDQLAEVRDRASFDEMKKVEQDRSFSEPWMQPRNDAPKVRKGKPGGYREELSDEDVAYLDDVFSSLLPANHAPTRARS